MTRSLYLNPATYDLDVTDTFDLRFTETDTEIISQSIEGQMKLFLGEDFLNRDNGVPYFEQIMIQNPDLSTAKNLLLTAALKAVGVVRAIKFDLVFDPQARTLRVDSEFEGESGQIISVETIL